MEVSSLYAVARVLPRSFGVDKDVDESVRAVLGSKRMTWMTEPFPTNTSSTGKLKCTSGATLRQTPHTRWSSLLARQLSSHTKQNDRHKNCTLPRSLRISYAPLFHIPTTSCFPGRRGHDALGGTPHGIDRIATTTLRRSNAPAFPWP